MSKLQEMLAAKKAKEEAAKAPTVHSVQTKIIEAQKEMQAVDAAITQAEKTMPDPVKQEEPAVAAPKVLSFAEKMALKKQQEAAGKITQVEPAPDAPISSAKPATIPASAATIAVVQNPNNVAEKLRTGVLDATLDKNPMPLPTPAPAEDAVDPATAQAYADIKARIDTLNDKADADLKGAMTDLKKALMQNPAAVSLMEDADIGQLVIALRRITGEAIAEASKESKPGRKPGAAKNKTVDLTDPDVVAGIFNEL